MFLAKLTTESPEYWFQLGFFKVCLCVSLGNFCFEISSSFQSHIKIESPKPDTCQAQQENMDEKAKPFRYNCIYANKLFAQPDLW